jgi:hypothetical protein
LRTIAGSAPATDNTPARDVAPSVVRAAQIENVKECKYHVPRELPTNLCSRLIGGDSFVFMHGWLYSHSSSPHSLPP